MTQITGDWLTNPATQRVLRLLEDSGAQAFVVGGCVRNALLGVAVSDIDIATDARPQAVMDMARTAGIKAVPTGFDHGTVTLVVDGLGHEITTFRRDVETDGRRAVVTYSDTITDDAARRDFTMNALYARRDGTVLDPLGGLPDLRARRVRFIGDANERIREDYLRSLRFFRFHAWYGDTDAGFDPDALAAIAENLDGLPALSHERIGAEMLKLLGAPDPAPAIAVMNRIGALQIFLPGADDRALAPLIHLETESNTGPSTLCRLAALGATDAGDALRLSRQQDRDQRELRAGAVDGASAAELAYRHGADTARAMLVLRSALMEQPWSPGLEPEIAKGAAATFPISAADLMPGLQGAALGARLKSLEAAWVASGFALSRDALLVLD